MKIKGYKQPNMNGLADYVDYIFQHVLRVKPISVDVDDRTINVMLPNEIGNVLVILNLTNLMVSYGLPATSHTINEDLVTFMLSPAKPIEEVSEEVFGNILSRWTKQTEFSDALINQPLVDVFRSVYQYTSIISWNVCNDMLDLTVEAPNLFTINGYAAGPHDRGQLYEETNDCYLFLLQASLHTIRPIMEARLNRGFLDGLVVLQTNTKPNWFHVEDHTNNSEIKSYYDGNEYTVDAKFEASANILVTQNLVELWKNNLAAKLFQNSHLCN